jgi:HAD superfamily hydrolase (TIGR01509 family)
MKQYPYALFDMDGTLVDSMTYWRTAPIVLTEQVTGPLPEARRAALIGARTYGEAERILASWGIHMDRAEMTERANRLMGEHYQNDVLPKRGAIPLLEELKKQGTNMAVLTLTPHREAELCLERTGLAPYFSFVMTPEDNPTGHGKEEPGIFRLALQKMGCDDPAKCAFYEDSYYAIRTAHALGMPIFAVADKWAEAEKELILPLCEEWLDLDAEKR